MLLTLFLTAVIAGIGLWFYKRKQIIALTEQLRDKEAIITVLTAHVEPAMPSYQAQPVTPQVQRVKPLREGNEKNIKPAPTKPRPKAPAPQSKPPAQKQANTDSVDGNQRRRRRSHKPKTTTNK